MAATPHVPAAGSTGLQVTSSKRLFDLTGEATPSWGALYRPPWRVRTNVRTLQGRGSNHKNSGGSNPGASVLPREGKSYNQK